MFYWVHKIQEDFLQLIVMSEDKTQSSLICDFSYKELNVYFRNLVKNDDFYKDNFLIIAPGVLTPYVVRPTIDLALKAGWKPFKEGSDFALTNIEHKIDINFWTESTAEDRQSKIQNPKSYERYSGRQRLAFSNI